MARNNDVTASVPPTLWAPAYNGRTPMTRIALHARHSSAAVAALTCAAVIAACGSAGKPAGTGAGGGPLLAYARCIRAHGVPNFPDPSPTGGLIISDDIDPQSPAFRSAQRACNQLAQSGRGQTDASESRKLQLLSLARCMRTHGVPNFPDPTSSPPPPSSGNVIGGGGWFLALGPAPERQSPAYKRATAACRAGLP